MTVRDALNWGTIRLRSHRCDGASRAAANECDWLLRFAARLTREQLLAMPDRALSATAERRFRETISRRLHHEPLAWILGTEWFMGREFKVSPDTLIPRPATEVVVTAAVAAARNAVADIAVDVGTGSGCIAVSLAFELPGLTIIATDTSIPAVMMARRNARRLGVAKRMIFRKTNLLGAEPTHGHASKRPVPIPATAIPLIIANLPYIPGGDAKTLSACVRHEPASALFGGKDGLDPSRALLAQVATLPNKKIILAFEILAKQFTSLAASLKNIFPTAQPTRIKNQQGVTVGLLAQITK